MSYYPFKYYNGYLYFNITLQPFNKTITYFESLLGPDYIKYFTLDIYKPLEFYIFFNPGPIDLGDPIIYKNEKYKYKYFIKLFKLNNHKNLLEIILNVQSLNTYDKIMPYPKSYIYLLVYYPILEDKLFFSAEKVPENINDLLSEADIHLD